MIKPDRARAVLTVAALSMCLTQAADAALRLQATAAPDPAVPGDTLNVFFIVSNDGPSALTGVTVSLVVPANLDTFNESIAGASSASCNTSGSTTTCDTGETVTWVVGTLDPGEGQTLYFPPVVAAGTTPGTSITFAPDAGDDQLDSASAAATVEVQTAPALTLAIDDDRDPVPADEPLVYTLKYGHIATARFAPDATLSLNLPAGTNFASASDGGVHNAGVVTWSLGTLDPSQSGQVSTVVTTDASLDDGDLLLATASFADTDGESARAGTITRIRAGGPLKMTISADPDPVLPGQIQDVRITVSNTGFFDLSDVTITAPVPAKIDTFSEGVAGASSSSCNALGSTITCQNGERIVWNLGTLPAGEGVVVAMPPIVSADTATADIVSYGAWVRDSSGAEAASRESVEVRGEPAFELALDSNRNPVASGDSLTYELTYSHIATTSVAAGTTLVLPLPDGATLVEASDGGVFANGAVTWSLGTLGASEGGRVSASVTLDQNLADGSLLRAEAVIADAGSPVQVARASHVTRVLDDPPLRLAMEINPDPVRPGESHDVRLTATNISPFDIDNVRLLVLVPEDIDDFGESQAQPASGSCNTLGSTIVCQPRERLFWNVGNLAAGQGVTVALPPRAVESTTEAGVVTWRAWLTDDSALGAIHAVASDSLLVRGEPAFELAIDDSSDPVSPGEELRYALTYGHVAASRVAPGTLLSLPVPAGTSFVSASHGGALNDDVIEWPLGLLSPSTGGQVSAVLSVDNGLVAGTIIEATPALADTATPAETALARAITRVATDRPLTFSIEVNPDPVEPGQTQDVRLVVGNPGFFTRSGVTVRMVLPDETDDFSESLADADSASCNTLGSTATCQPRERLRYTVGDLPPGTSAAFSLPPVVSGDRPDSDVITYRGWVTEDNGTQADAYQSVVVATAPAFDLAISVDDAPAGTGENTTYRLTVGQREIGADDATLTMRLPDEAVFVSASDSGSLTGNSVTWTIPGLEQGEGTTRTVTVAVDAATQGRLLRAAAEVTKTSLDPGETRAVNTTPAGMNSPLLLTMTMSPSPAVPRDTLTIDLTVENTTGLPVADVTLTVRMPAYLEDLSESLLDANSGSCNQLGSTAVCQSRELLFWSIGDLAAGDSITVGFPPVIRDSDAPANGTVIRTHGFAEAPDVPRFGISADVLVSDDDGIGDPFDNCLWEANPGQLDTDGDNIGNACDGDISQPNDCFVNFLDLNVLSDAFFTNPASPSWNPDADLSGDNFVNFLDLSLMSDLFFLSPGPSGTGSACD